MTTARVRREETERVLAWFARLTERTAPTAALNLLAPEVAALLRVLTKRHARRAQQPLTLPVQHAMVLAARTTAVRVLLALRGGLPPLQATAHNDAVRAVARFFSAMQGGAPTTLDDPRTLAKLAGRRATMNARLRTAGANTVRAMANAVRGALATARQQGATVGQAVHLVGTTLNGQGWRLARIARTEAAFAANGAAHDAIALLAREHRHLYQRWTERVVDTTWQPMDPRVAADSMALHGQVSPAGGEFTMPPHPAVSAKLHGKTWHYPPNRPHDRAIVLPWLRAWGAPAWRWRSARRVWLVAR